jgi:glutamine amidotransferase
VQVAVVDYGAGNLRSVEIALRHLGADFASTRRPEELATARRLIVPGVGEARAAMEALEAGGLDRAIREFTASGRPVLGVPHMGWNRVFRHGAHPLLVGIPDGAFFYFVHSYYSDPSDPELVLASCDYGLRFAAGVGRGNLAAFQFHPEKSGLTGLRLLANFLAWEP